MFNRLLLLLPVLCFFCVMSQSAWASTKVAQSISSSDSNDQTNQKLTQLLSKLTIKQGKGSFSQKKHFKFLSVPISSSGRFIVHQQSALWQTEKPVFSELLLKPQAIYRRLSADNEFRVLTESSEFSSILTTIFTGQINPQDWYIPNSEQLAKSDSCLLLKPKAQQLAQIFKEVSLCALVMEEPVRKNTEDPADEYANKGNKKLRQIDLLDQQGNKTQITMTIFSERLNQAELRMLQVTHNATTDTKAAIAEVSSNNDK